MPADNPTNRFSVMRLCAVASLCSLTTISSVALKAQAWPRSDRGLFPPAGEYVYILPDASRTNATFSFWDTGISSALGSYPVELVGAVKDFPNFTVLIGGRDDLGDEGLLLKFSRDQSGQVVEPHRVTWAGSDIVGIAYDSVAAIPTLYVLDSVGRRILSAPYSSNNPLPNSWNLFADAGIVTALADPNLHEFDLSIDEQGRRLLIKKHGSNSLSGSFTWVDIQTKIETTLPGVDSWPYLTGNIKIGDTTVAFGAAPGTTVEIQNGQGGSWTTIGTGVANASGVGVAVVPSLSFGDNLAARAGTMPQPSPPVRQPFLCLGAVSRIDGGSVIRPVDPLPNTVYVGNQDCDFGVYIDHDNPAQVSYPVMYAAACAVGTPDDIVYPPAGSPYLNTPFTISTSVVVADDQRPGFGCAKLPIPDAPELQGGLVSVQFWIALPSGGVAVSDIATVMVLDARFNYDIGPLLNPGTGPVTSSAVLGGGRTPRTWAGGQESTLLALLCSQTNLLSAATNRRFLKLIRSGKR